MAFQQRGKPQQKRNNNNYFTTSIQKGGENFMKSKDASKLQLDAVRIFRDLARGNIDIYQYSHYFLDPMMLNACISAASLKLSYYSISFNGVNYMVSHLTSSGTPVDVTVLEVMEDHKRSTEAYQLIVNAFISLQTTGDIGYIISLVSALSRYKYNI